MDLLKSNIDLIKSGEKNIHMIFKNALQEIKGLYDLVIVDSPPDINFTVLNTLIATDEVIAVITPDGFSRKGLRNMNVQLKSIQKLAPRILFRGCILNKCINTQNTKTCLDELKNEFPMFSQTLRYTKGRVDQANHDNKSIYEISPGCGFAQDLKKLTKEILN